MQNEMFDVATEALGTETVEPSTSGGLTPSVDIDVIIAKRSVYAHALEDAALALQRASIYGEADFTLRSAGRYRHFSFPSREGIAELLRRYDSAAWSHLLNESGLRAFMDSTSREAWAKALEEGTAPDLTRENVAATFTEIHAQRVSMFERGVIEVFHKLSWDYKTNSPRMFGKRIVMRGAGSFGLLNSDWCNRLDDIIRVMMVLDGKPEPDTRQSAWSLLTTDLRAAGRGIALNWPPKDKQPKTLRDLLLLRGFKNGNTHVTFLRPDLVEKMNKILAKHHKNALPPADL